MKAKAPIGAIHTTASHNPPTDNGFKVRDETGGAIAPDGLKQIELLIPADTASVKRVKFAEAVSSGIIIKFDPDPEYLEQLHRMIDLAPVRQCGMKILVD